VRSKALKLRAMQDEQLAELRQTILKERSPPPFPDNTFCATFQNFGVQWTMLNKARIVPTNTMCPQAF